MMLTNAKLPVVFIFLIALSASCKKDINAIKSSEGDSNASDDNFFQSPKSSCRLRSWQGLDDGYQRTMEYNNKGLVEKWQETVPASDVDQLTTYKYDRDQRVSSLNYYDHGTLIYVVVPIYKFGHIAKELWYLADGITLDDQSVNTYDWKGRLVKRESLNYDYYAKFEYDAIGNNTHYALKGTSDGFLYDSLVQGFDKPVREPMVAVPGLSYPIQYLNYIISKEKYTRYKEVYDDGTGNIVTAFEIDPSQSDLRAGPDDYAVYYKSFNIIGQFSYRQVWYYENCNCPYQGFSFSDNQSKAPLSVTPIKNRTYPRLMDVNEIKARIISRKMQAPKSKMY